MTARLDGQAVLVTGSTAGLGRDMAQRFAAADAAVVITGRSRDRGTAVAAAIAARGGRGHYVATNMAEEPQVAAAVVAAETRFGKLTGLVNNAATIQGRCDGPLTEIASEDWLHILNVDFAGTYFALKNGLRAIARAGGGSAVNISSAAGLTGNHAYTACKGAIQAHTRALAGYYSRYLIRVNCLIVGTIDRRRESTHARQSGDRLEIAPTLSRPGRPAARGVRRGGLPVFSGGKFHQRGRTTGR
ncbi:MAG: oxidoreductase [Bradyrhizobium sp.]|jgi:NAD(P)-dependent dehydrogenase (short-subunit alcohol dehydrogenase family)|nr:oxidoreductase [Bradyrhizobium sp.]